MLPWFIGTVEFWPQQGCVIELYLGVLWINMDGLPKVLGGLLGFI